MANLPTLNIGAATASNLSTVVADVTVAPLQQDSAGSQEETIWQNNEWTQQWAWFNNVPEFHAAMLMKAIWVCGKGYEADPETTVILENISGTGKETFEDVLFNMCLISRVAGDAFAEIMEDEDGNLLNLKPLDPGSMRIHCNKKGMITKYSQIKNGIVETFNPREIFHLSHNKLADQIHGISDSKSIKDTFLAEYESFTDTRKIMHRQARPLVIFKLKTDDQAKITAFISKMDAAWNQGECIYIPDDENMLAYEIVQVDVSNTILAWRNDINNKFYRAVGLPQILFGSAGSTESGGKMEYLAHETVFEYEQRYLEKQVLNQLGLKIDLVPPTSLLPNLQTDQNKDSNQGMEMQSNDMTAGRGE